MRFCLGVVKVRLVGRLQVMKKVRISLALFKREVY